MMPRPDITRLTKRTPANAPVPTERHVRVGQGWLLPRAYDQSLLWGQLRECMMGLGLIPVGH